MEKAEIKRMPISPEEEKRLTIDLSQQ